MGKEYIKLSEDRFLVKDSCGIIVSRQEMLEEQKKENESKEAKNGDSKLNAKQKAKITDKSDNIS